jgi:hypothetical protein
MHYPVPVPLLRPLPLLLLPLLTLLGTPACSSNSDPLCACTEEFRTFTVTILDDAMQPAENLTLVRTNLRTGKILDPGRLGMLVPGTWLVADDGMVDEFSDAGDTLRVAITQSGFTTSVDFVFRVPEPCRCHVEFVAGPDTVVIGEPPP